MAFVTDNITIEGLEDKLITRYNPNIQATANTTTSLTSASNSLQIFTGSTSGQIIKLPSGTTLTNGWQFLVYNASTQIITIQDNGGNQIIQIGAGQNVSIFLQSNATTNGVWLSSLTSSIHYLSAASLAEFVQGISYLQAVGGGTLHITGTITLAANLTVDTTNVRIVSDDSPTNAIVLNSFVLNLKGTSSYFGNVRFTGSTAAGARSQLAITTDASIAAAYFMWFDNCVFKNIVGDTALNTANTPSGICIDCANTPGVAVNIVFSSCNVTTDGIGTSTYLYGLGTRFGTGALNQIFIASHIGQVEGRNRFVMAPVSGTASAATKIIFNTDGTGVLVGTLEVPSLGTVNYASSVAAHAIKKYLSATTGTTLSVIKDDANYINDGVIAVNAASANQTLTMPATTFYMDGFSLVFNKAGGYNLTLVPNGTATVNGSGSNYVSRGYNTQLVATYNQSAGNWVIVEDNNRNANSVATTDATVTTLSTITIPTDSVVFVEARILARRTGGSAGTAGDSAAYVRRIRYKNVGGTVTANAPTTEFTDEDQAAWNATLDVSGTTGRIRVTGATNNNITWFSEFDVEVVV